MEERLARLRALLTQQPSKETWEHLLTIFQDWPPHESRQMAIDYAKTHLQAWPSSLKQLNEFDSKHPCWPLASKVCVSTTKEHQALPQLSSHPHITHLSIEGGATFHDCKLLQGLSQLKSIDLQEIIELRDIEVLTSLTKLEELFIPFLPQWPTFVEKLQELPRLRKLHIQQEWMGSPPFSTGFSTRANARQQTPQFLDLASLSPLTQLTELHISGFTPLQGFDALNHLKNLESLLLHSTNSELPRDFLLELPQLHTLSLYHTKTPDLRVFVHLTKLSSLHLASSSIEHLEGIEKLTSLQNLHLSNCPSLVQVSLTSAQNNLSTLKISTCPKLESLDGMMHCEHLQKLSIEECEALQSLDLKAQQQLTSLHLLLSPSLQKLEGLEKLHSLKEFSCRHPFQEVDVSGMISLETLKITDSDAFATLKGLSNCAQLRELSLCSCPQLEKIEGLEKLQELEALYSIHVPYSWDLSVLGTFPKLRILYIDECKHLRNLKGLEQAPLESIHLEQCLSLETLDGIEKTKTLKEIYLQNNEKLSDIKALTNLTNIHNLRILESPSLVEITALKDLPALEMLVLSECPALAVSPKEEMLQKKEEIARFQKKLTKHASGRSFWPFS